MKTLLARARPLALPAAALAQVRPRRSGLARLLGAGRLRSACPTGPASSPRTNMRAGRRGRRGRRRPSPNERAVPARRARARRENGGWTQKVPLIRTQLAQGGFTYREGRRDPAPRFPATSISPPSRETERARIENAPMVFVGYGVTAPERRLGRFQGRRPQGQGRGLPGQRSRFRGGSRASRWPAVSAARR